MRGAGGQAGRKRLTWCLLLLLAVGVAVVFTQSRYAQLQEVAVTGVSRLDAEQVKEVSGLRPGQSVFSLRPRQVAARIQSLAWVKEARVTWAWPGRAVIRVSERTPVALVPCHDRFLVVDGEGRVLTTSPEWTPWGLPLVTGPVPPDLVAGQFITDGAILGALACVEAFPPAARERLGEVHAGEGGELIVYDLEGVPALVGLADAHLAGRIQVLLAIWEDLGRQGVRAEYIDVRDSSRAIVKPAQGG